MPTELEKKQEVENLKKWLPDYLQKTRPQVGSNLKNPFPCPFHEDRGRPNCSYDKTHNRIHCFVCNKSWSLFDLIGRDENLPKFVDQLQRLRQMYGSDKTKKAKPPLKQTMFAATKPEATDAAKIEAVERLCSEAEKHSEETGFWYSRGLNNETIRRFRLGFNSSLQVYVEGKPVKWKAAIIPTAKGCCTIRNTDVLPDAKGLPSGGKVQVKGHRVLFNPEALDIAERPIFVVEGEIDAMTIEQCGFPAVALGGCGMKSELITRAAKGIEKGLILALDADEAGRKMSKELMKEFSNTPTRVYELTDKPFGDYHDANDAFLKDAEWFVEYLERVTSSAEASFSAEKIKERENYYDECQSKRRLADFLASLSRKVRPISTGFKYFDQVLGGGLYEGLIVVGATPGRGKTTLCLQVADNVAKAGKDVLIFSMEMSRYELIAKSLSRLVYEKAKASADIQEEEVALSALEIRTGLYVDKPRSQKYFVDALAEYESFADRVFIIEGMDSITVNSIRDAVEKHVEATGKTPIVVVDYMQLIAPLDPRSTDKQNTDKTVFGLKRISRDFRTTVLVISSFNRGGYNDKGTQAKMESFKESGMIEYSCDVLISLMPEENGIEKQGARRIDLVTLKNRNAPNKRHCFFDFRGKYNIFEEDSSKGIQEEKG